MFVEALKAREDIEALREQYDNSTREYDKLQTEHQKLQVNHLMKVFIEIFNDLFSRTNCRFYRKANQKKINKQIEI